MDPKDTKKRFEEAYKLLTKETTSREKFESIRILIKGFNPKLDASLEKVSSALSDVEKLQKGDVIDLTVEHLPETTDEEKRRKKALLFLIKQWHGLESEINRVRAEIERLDQDSSNQGKAEGIGRIALKAKGPFGVLTLGAVLIVGAIILIQSLKGNETKNTVTEESSKAEKIKVIIVNNKKIPLSETIVGNGPECSNSDHYHARNHETAKALDGTTVVDPGGCGFGKVDEVKIEEVPTVAY